MVMIDIFEPWSHFPPHPVWIFKYGDIPLWQEVSQLQEKDQGNETRKKYNGHKNDNNRGKGDGWHWWDKKMEQPFQNNFFIFAKVRTIAVEIFCHSSSAKKTILDDMLRMEQPGQNCLGSLYFQTYYPGDNIMVANGYHLLFTPSSWWLSVVIAMTDDSLKDVGEL